MGDYHLTGRTRAPIEVVWPLIGQADRWKEWAWMTRTFLVKEGSPDRDGVGAIRRFAVGPFGSREEVVAFEPPRHLGYVALKGLPVRSYRADVNLTSLADGGTQIDWRGQFEALMPGTDAAVGSYIRGLVKGFTRRVCAHADEIAGGQAGLSVKTPRP